nr:hypothetical protein [Tanacetum cinerariifolium]
TRTISSHSSASLDSTAPLSPDHPLTHALPTPTPTRVLFHRRTTRMAVRTQLTLSPGMFSRIAEATAFSPSSFHKRYRSSYDISSSSSPTLPTRKRYRDTCKIILDTETKDESSDSDAEREGRGLDDEGHALDDEGYGLDNEGHGLDDEGHGLEDEGPGSEEEEAAPKGQQQAVPVMDTAASEPLGIGYEELRRHELDLREGSMPSTFEVMSAPAYVDLETITQVDEAQRSRVPVPLPDDPYVAIRQAQLVDTVTESEPEE